MNMLYDRLRSEIDNDVRELRRSASDFSELASRIDDERESIRRYWRRFQLQPQSDIVSRLQTFTTDLYTLELDNEALIAKRDDCQVLICKVLSNCYLLAETGLEDDTFQLRSRARLGLSALVDALGLLPHDFAVPAAAFIIANFDRLLANHAGTPPKISVMRRHLLSIRGRLL